ncbi:MAG: oligosaccharide repeat unit polymerase [Caulobacteraceae bacterium]|nr:oligosaccharide repeat unit polymerase [Caulobacteraceae bacterium]
MLIKFAISTSYLILALASLWVLRPFRGGSPFFWFIVAQSVMAVGTFAISDFERVGHVYYAVLYFAAHFVFVAAVVFYVHRARVHDAMLDFFRRRETDEHQDVKTLVAAIMVISIAVTIIYYQAVGYNIIVQLLVGGVSDYSTERLATYSGEDYFAPGYVNQFKNVLLPISVAAVGFWIWRAGNRTAFAAYCAVMGPVTILALAGTGQRGYLFYTTAAFLMSFVLHWSGRARLRLGKVAVFASPVVVVFLFMTSIYYGRESGGVLTALGDTMKRFTTYQQESGLVGFDYVLTLPIQNFAEWGKALLGIIPGQEGSRLSHDVHAIMFGTDRGTAPLTPVGSAYHNAGMPGVIMLYGLLGLAYASAYRRYVSGPRTVIRSLSYGFMFLYLALYLAESPIALIDNGVLAICLLLFLVRIAETRGTSVPNRHAPSTP